jgi:hypothetical protein
MRYSSEERSMRVCKQHVSAAVVAILMASLGVSAAPPDNMILVNPSFETDANGNGFADGWAE